MTRYLLGFATCTAIVGALTAATGFVSPLVVAVYGAGMIVGAVVAGREGHRVGYRDGVDQAARTRARRDAQRTAATGSDHATPDRTVWRP